MSEEAALAALDLPPKVEAKEEPKEVEKAEVAEKLDFKALRERADEGERTRASKNGWRPFEEYVEAGGDPEKWRDAPTFNIVGEFTKKLREKDREFDERLQGVNKIHSVQLAGLQDKRDEAIEAGDKDKVKQVDQQIAQLNAPVGPRSDKLLDDWNDRNSWINEESPKSIYAQTQFAKAVNSGKTTKDALEHVETLLAKHYPVAKAPERKAIDTGEKGGGSKGFGKGHEVALTMKDLTAQERQIYEITGSAYKSQADFLRAAADARKGA